MQQKSLSRAALKDQQREQRRLERAVTALEDKMAALTDERDTLNVAMNDPENGADLAKLTELSERIADLDAQLTEIEDQWTEASIALETFIAEK